VLFRSKSLEEVQ